MRHFAIGCKGALLKAAFFFHIRAHTSAYPAVPGQPRAQVIRGWPGVRRWPGNSGPSTESADGLAFPTKTKNFLGN